jgi:hypothetical protein
MESYYNSTEKEVSKMKLTSKITILIVLLISLGFAITIKSRPPCLKLIGDETMQGGYGIPYLGGRQSPGDQIGTTYYDFQANGTFGQRIKVDDGDQGHIDWMKMNEAESHRYCAWNFRYADGTYYGETQASPSWSGYVQIDVTRDALIDDQRSVIAYHYEDQGYIDVDAGNGWGNWPNDPQHVPDSPRNWPYIAVAENNNVVVVTGNEPTGGPEHYMYMTTDFGHNWTHIADYDSCGTLSQFLRASQNSNKVAHVWTKYIETIDGNDQLANDVYYQISNDGGATWNAPVNVTNYAAPSTLINGDSQPYAYCNVNAIFDNNDDLHIAWAGHLAYVHNDTANYMLYHAKIFHWDEVSTTITQVNHPSPFYDTIDGGWWLDLNSRSGSWRTACDQPQLVLDQSNGDLYCLWHGNADTTDYSAANFLNSEIYCAMSIDNGTTWFDHTNLTNTQSPGALAGDCMDEDYMTANPLVVNDHIFITYVEDKDAGGYPVPEGSKTENPVRCWVFVKPGVEEQNTDTPKIANLIISPNPSVHNARVSYTLPKSCNVSIKLFDIAGRLVKKLDEGFKEAGTHSLNIDTNELSSGTLFLIIDAPIGCISQRLVIVK